MATKILIVEDTDDIRDALVIGFTEEGFRVAAAARGEEAFAELSAFTPDIVLLDMHLPGMSGIEILKRLRETLTVPILMYTNSSVVETVKDAIRSGATDYVLKETGMEGLIARVNKHLNANKAPAKPASPPPAPVVANRSVQLLYVGEDDMILHMISDTARRLSIESTRVSTAKVALSRLSESGPVIVVTEMKLRDSDGLSLFKAINSGKDRHSFVPVIFVADTAPPEKRRSALGLGAAAFFLKPVSAMDFEQLMRKLVRLVMKRRAA